MTLSTETETTRPLAVVGRYVPLTGSMDAILSKEALTPMSKRSVEEALKCLVNDAAKESFFRRAYLWTLSRYVNRGICLRNKRAAAETAYEHEMEKLDALAEKRREAFPDCTALIAHLRDEKREKRRDSYTMRLELIETQSVGGVEEMQEQVVLVSDAFPIDPVTTILDLLLAIQAKPEMMDAGRAHIEYYLRSTGRWPLAGSRLRPAAVDGNEVASKIPPTTEGTDHSSERCKRVIAELCRMQLSPVIDLFCRCTEAWSIADLVTGWRGCPCGHMARMTDFIRRGIATS